MSDELLDAITTCDKFDDDVFSARELARTLDVSRSTVTAHLRDLYDEGRCEHAGHRESSNMAGKKCQIPVYRIVEE